MSDKPIFIQLQEMIEDNILEGSYNAGQLVISSTQIVKLYNVNPATAIKALSQLVSDGILEKDRGIGMRVTNDAYGIILKRRKDQFLLKDLKSFVLEAERIGITKADLIDLIKIEFKEEING